MEKRGTEFAPGDRRHRPQKSQRDDDPEISDEGSAGGNWLAPLTTWDQHLACELSIGQAASSRPRRLPRFAFYGDSSSSKLAVQYSTVLYVRVARPARDHVSLSARSGHGSLRGICCSISRHPAATTSTAIRSAIGHVWSWTLPVARLSDQRRGAVGFWQGVAFGEYWTAH